MMKIEKFKVEKNKLKFDLRNASVSVANAIRRIMVSEIPVMAIDEVDFFENTTSLFDEYIAHRLGLIPLVTDLKSYKLASECCGGNCSKCSTILALDFKGPGTAYSRELRGKDKNIVPVFDNIPIMKLEENQALKLEAKAILGTGKTHAKFQSCVCSYKVQKTNERNFEFEVESFGNLHSKELYNQTIKIIENKITELEKQIKIK